MDPGVSRILIVVGILLMLAMCYRPASSHENYPAYCCNGDGEHGDCKAIECDGIAETKTGYDWEGFHFRPNQTMPSFDQKCHACVQKNKTPLCLFILPSS